MSSVIDFLLRRDDPRDFHELAREIILERPEFEEEYRRTESMWSIPSRQTLPVSVLDSDEDFDLMSMIESRGCSKWDRRRRLLTSFWRDNPVEPLCDISELIGDTGEREVISEMPLLPASELELGC